MSPKYPGAIDPVEFIDWGINSLLNVLARLSGKFGSGSISKGHFLKETSVYRYDSNSKKKFSQAFYKLKQSGYIYFEGESIRITNKTKMKMVDKFGHQSNNYRLVSFDIPERLKTNRNLFRRAIKRMGFKQIQKSLWVSNRNLGNLVEIAAEEYGVSDYVAYFISNKSNIDQHIRDLLAKK